jgi:hypothetical protein
MLMHTMSIGSGQILKKYLIWINHTHIAYARTIARMPACQN